MSELATSKQLWVINKLTSELGITTSEIFDSKEFSLPLTKDEASLLVARLKIAEKNSFSTSLDKLAELQKKTTQEEYWAKTRKN
tara:strand:- start:152 stop:403 length:252 start_codon:yes stop_codon:yes gene_type:complete